MLRQVAPITRRGYRLGVKAVATVYAGRLVIPRSTVCLVSKPYAQIRGFHSTRPVFDDHSEDQRAHNNVVGSSLLPVVNKLQEVCSLVGSDLHLPQIVVIGGQSSGKSSVLENLVGRDFLPRGSGLVTRRPLILQLNRVENSTEEWGEFAHRPNEKFTFAQIRHEIEAETEKLLGIKSKRISDQPIILKIFAPDVLPLTLVDTPGMTRVPVGDQPQDIEEQIRKMVHDVISNPNAIILAVHAANQDLATSDALKLAREVDAEGKRTVGVVTKLDLMDKGTDAMEILLGKAYPLKLGFVGVVCRSQQEIRADKPISKALKDEAEWFKNHSVYNTVAPQTGTKVLSIKCNRMLTRHIRESLPDVKNQVRSMIKSTERELETYGFPIGRTTAEQGWILMEMLNKFTNQFRADIEGVREEVVTNQINGGARIYYIFNQTFVKQIQAMNPSEALSDQQIRIVLRNAAGTRPSLFIPERAFEMLIKKRIEKLKDPGLQVAELILDELVRIAGAAEAKTLSRFPVLRERVGEISGHVLRKCLSPALKMISDIVDCESAYINTTHADFDGPRSVLASEALQTASKEDRELREKATKRKSEEERSGFLGFLFGSPKDDVAAQTKQSVNRNETSPPQVLRIEEEVTDAERAQIRLMKKLLNSYFDIAQRNVRENVIKVVMHFLVHKSHEVLGKELVTSLYKEEIFEELLREADGVVSRRIAATTRLEALKKAKKVLQITELKDMPLQYY